MTNGELREKLALALEDMKAKAIEMIAHGTTPGEVVRDEEGMQTMRQLGLNMAFMIKSIRLGLQQFGSPKIQEELTETHYIR